ncbi:MAG: phospholipase A1 [Gammaproteobacteria bacterium]|nr:MAG: phospholipase A1 [Gammaproteobacteria bacterium]TND03483.1 MAG: phospholipase A1 [Gammaproteobacteria bacterium]
MKPGIAARFFLLLLIVSREVLSGTVQADEPPLSAIDERIVKEQAAFQNRFALMPHKPSYILPLSYASKVNQAPFEDLGGDAEHLEVKFQISLKLPLMRNLFGNNGHLSFGYTQVSFWQAYNSQVSSPFRETDHEPELMLSFFNDYRLFGVRNRIITLGLVHQSNGQLGARSRSWSRVYANFLFERSRWAFSLRPWYRIPESVEDDDNPDIDQYLGHGEVIAAYRLGEHVLDLMLRNNLDSPNRGAISVGWSFPINERVNGFVQYFNGYGESLIDYNTSISRIGLGIMLTNWL